MFSLDFNDAPAQGEKPTLPERRDLNYIKAEVNQNALPILFHLFPAGKINGHEFEIGNIGGSPGDSLKVSLKEGKFGVWADYATGQKGSNLIDLWMGAKGCAFPEALKEIENYLNLNQNQNFTPTKLKSKPRDLGHPTHTWYYKDQSGTITATITRYDPKPIDENLEPKKEFIPYDCKLKKSTHPNPRPLYNIPGITNEKTVVLVEGEKCADALISLGIPATTTMGGAKAPTGKTDWTPLSGKDVLVWPDNDDPGKEYAQATKTAIEKIGGTARVIPIPAGKPKKWDAADAVEEGFDVKGFLLRVCECPSKSYKINLFDWNLGAYQGDPPVREWLVKHVFPMASVSILAAAGGSGKGMLGLDLALKVVCDYGPNVLEPFPKAFGNDVVQRGSVVIFSAEDDQGEIHRRFAGIDPGGIRDSYKDKLIVVPLPNTGGPAPIIVPSKNGPETTDIFQEIREQLLSIKDLKLVIFDPLSSFAIVDINTSPIDGSFTLGVLASLASDTGASVIAAHHLSKLRVDKPITSPDAAKAMIRGSSALVDGSRVSYCLWPMDQDEAKRKCKRLKMDYIRGDSFSGTVVKANVPVDKEIKSFIRASNGLLYVMDDALRTAKISKEDLVEAFLDVVRRGALAGRPFTVSSRKETCFADRREELPVELKDMGKNRMMAILNELIETGKVLKCVAAGSKAAIWLDVPEGPFSEGLGKFEPGFVTI